MKKTSAILALTALLLPGMALAAPAKKTAHHPKPKTAAYYECAKCHMKYSASEAKKDHYIDPMDGGKLLPAKAGGKKTM